MIARPASVPAAVAMEAIAWAATVGISKVNAFVEPRRDSVSWHCRSQTQAAVELDGRTQASDSLGHARLGERGAPLKLRKVARDPTLCTFIQPEPSDTQAHSCAPKCT